MKGAGACRQKRNKNLQVHIDCKIYFSIQILKCEKVILSLENLNILWNHGKVMFCWECIYHKAWFFLFQIFSGCLMADVILKGFVASWRKREGLENWNKQVRWWQLPYRKIAVYKVLNQMFFIYFISKSFYNQKTWLLLALFYG